MGENHTETLKRIIRWIYIVGCFLWFLLWYSLGGYALMPRFPTLWIPFVSCFVILIVNIVLWESAVSCEKYDVEVTVIEFVERNAAHVITAIAALLLIATAISAIKKGAALPKDFIIFQCMAFIFAVVGVLPLYWIPSEKVHWLVILRHFKTVPFTYSISCFLSGIIILLHWL